MVRIAYARGESRWRAQANLNTFKYHFRTSQTDELLMSWKIITSYAAGMLEKLCPSRNRLDASHFSLRMIIIT